MAHLTGVPIYRHDTAPAFLDRWTEWVELSRHVEHLDPAIGYLTQQVGRLDADLEAEAAGVIAAARASPNPRKELQAMTDHIFFSTLWVFACYELLRTLDARLGDRPLVTEARRLFERVRVPLAKLEPARRHRETDLRWPVMVVHRDNLGVGWRVADDQMVSRDQLSSAIRAAVRSVRPSQ